MKTKKTKDNVVKDLFVIILFVALSFMMGLIGYGIGYPSGYIKGHDDGLTESRITAQYGWLQCLEDNCDQAKETSLWIVNELDKRKLAIDSKSR